MAALIEMIFSCAMSINTYIIMRWIQISLHGIFMRKTAIIDILSTARPFRYLKETEITTIQAFGQIVTFAPGETILAQGKPGHGLHILLDGKAHISVRVLGTGTISLAALTPGEFFGEVSLLQDILCTATVTATTKSTCYLLNRQCYEAFALGLAAIRHAINRAVIEDVLQRQYGMYQNIETLLQKTVKQKPKSTVPHTIGKPKIIKMTPPQLLAEYGYLRQFPLFHLFTQHELERLIKNCKVVTFRERTCVIQKGQLNASCFFIVSGSVQVTINSKSRISKLAALGPNTIFCPIGPLNNKPEIFTYDTLTSITLLELTSDYLQSISQKDTDLWYKCYDLFCRYIVSLQEKMNTQIIRLNTEKYVTHVKEK
jgi:CRP-like cAMP-binding protein